MYRTGSELFHSKINYTLDLLKQMYGINGRTIPNNSRKNRE